MDRNNRSLLTAAVFFAAVLLCSCASRSPVDLPEGIRQTKGLTIGVAFDRVCEPEAAIEGVPVRGMGPSGSGPGLFGAQDERYWGNRHPILLSDKRRLEEYLRTRDAEVSREIRQRVVDELSARGWNAVVLENRVRGDELPRFKGAAEGYAEQDYRGAASGTGLDALLVLDCTWYGVHCYYTGYYYQAFTDASATLTGKLVDLETNRILWLSEEIGVSNSIDCRCNDSRDFPCIGDAVRAAAQQAASSLVRDFAGT